MEQTYFLQDLATLYLEAIKEARASLKHREGADQMHGQGEIWAWYCALSLLRDQVEVFNIVLPNLEAMALENLLQP